MSLNNSDDVRRLRLRAKGASMRLFERIASSAKSLAPSRRGINAAAPGVAKLVSNAKSLLPTKAKPPEDCPPPIPQKPKMNEKKTVVVETVKAPRMSAPSQPTKPRRPSSQQLPSFSEAIHSAAEQKLAKRNGGRRINFALLVMAGVAIFCLGRWSLPSVPLKSANPMNVETPVLRSNGAVVANEDDQIGGKDHNAESNVPPIAAQPSEAVEASQLAPTAILDESLPADTHPPKESPPSITPSAGPMSAFFKHPGLGYDWIATYTEADGTRVEGHWRKSDRNTDSPTKRPSQPFSSPPKSSGYSQPSPSPASKSESLPDVPDSSRRPSNYGTTQPAPPKATRTWVDGHWRNTKNGRTWVDAHWRDNN